jgi:hypothetical protein
VEVLEDRQVPASIVVHNLSDGPVGTLSPLEDGNYLAPNLRSAVADHNDFAGASTITLDAGRTYTLSGVFGGQLTIDNTTANTLTIQSNGSGLATIDAQGNLRVFRVVGAGATTLDHLQLVNGNGPSGGAINNSGALTVTNCAIANNFGDEGGGIDNGGTLTMANSTLSGNSSSEGGGICNTGTVTLANCTLANNSASPGGPGGGINNIGTVTLTNCTISGNSGTSGGGIFNAGPMTINNSIVANSTGGDITLSPPGTLSGSYNLIEDGSGGLAGTITGNPMLGSLANNGGPTQTFALLTGSPAINAGSDALAVDAQGNPLTTDQRGPGYARISGTAVDIGAFEVQQGAAELRARVNALLVAGVLSSSRANCLNTKLNLHGNGGDIGKVKSFLNQVNAYIHAGVLYYTDQSFAGVRVKQYKFLFTTKDTWLGTAMPLVTPAVFNLQWDPREQYDILFNGAAPTQGGMKTSPGRFAGTDHGWTLTGYMTPAMYPHFAEIEKIPNKPSKLKSGPYFIIPQDNRP